MEKRAVVLRPVSVAGVVSIRVVVRRWVSAALVIVAGCVCHAPIAVAAAGFTQSDTAVSVVMPGAVPDQGNGALSGDRAPVFQIHVLLPDTNVQCSMNDDGTYTACGTQQTSGCPAYQCWTYSPTVTDGENTIDIGEFTDGYAPGGLNVNFTTYGEAPHTTLATPPDPNDNYGGAQAWERPVFDIEAPSDLLPVTFQCALSATQAAPGRWGSCHLPRLRLTGIYRLGARAVDVFGRADPAPPQYVFSPTPCRAAVRGRMPRFSLIRHHGLPLTVTCIQPSRFGIELDVPDSWQYPCHGAEATELGSVGGHTTRTQQTLRLTLHTFRCVPSPASGTTPIPVQLLTIPSTSYGTGQVHSFRVNP